MKPKFGSLRSRGRLETCWALEAAGSPLAALAIYLAAGVVRNERRLEARVLKRRKADPGCIKW